MRLTTTTSALLIAPDGRIDHASADAFATALAPHLAQCNANSLPLILDFSGVEYISSVGLRVLVLTARQIKAQGGRIAIAALSPMVQEVFKISRFDLVYDVYDSVETAMTAVS